MWESEAPDAQAELRQGDLLLRVPLVKHLGEPQVDEDGKATLPVEVKDGIVVSQCCTAQQQGTVAIAPLQTIRLSKQRPDQLESLRRAEPDPNGGRFAVHKMLLEVHQSMDLQQDRQKVALLLEARIFATGPSTDWLRRRRTARMTVQGRRLLRVKLQAHWARPTEDDEIILHSLGLPVGASPAVVDLPREAS